jgi:hypothetical protein
MIIENVLNYMGDGNVSDIEDLIEFEEEFGLLLFYKLLSETRTQEESLPEQHEELPFFLSASEVV